MLPVAFEVLSAPAPQASRKPPAHADRENSTPFADMLDKSDTHDQSAPKDQASPDQPAPVVQNSEASAVANVKASEAPEAATDDTASKDVAAGAPVADPNTAEDALFAVIAEVTGQQAAPVAAPKPEAKPADAPKAEDESTNAATPPPVTTTSDAKTATAVAAVVSAAADASAMTAEVVPAESMGSPVAIDANAVAPDLAKATAKDQSGAAVDTKDTKPQANAKADVPALLPIDPDTSSAAKPAASAPLAQPLSAQSLGIAPAAELAPHAHTAKAAAAQPDIPAPDLATSKAADALQPLPILQNSAVSSTPANQAAPNTTQTATPQAVALPVAGIAVEIAGKALAGKNRFEIRLDPPELGRIHVRLDIDHKGEVTSIITADRSDTFDLLRRDAQALERALQDAGVKTSSNGLQFSLRDQGAGRHDQPMPPHDSARIIVLDDNLDTEIIAPVYQSLTGTRAGIDIRV